MKAAEFRAAIRAIEREIKRRAEEEADIRRRYREEMGVIYVREYTVRAHMRPIRAKKRTH